LSLGVCQASCLPHVAARRWTGLGWHLWDNTSEKAIPRNGAGTLEGTCSWGDGGGRRYCPSTAAGSRTALRELRVTDASLITLIVGVAVSLILIVIGCSFKKKTEP
jgi:hypothetical protein